MFDALEAKMVKNPIHWTVEELVPNAPLTQSFQYGEWQTASGKEVFRVRVDEEGHPLLFCQFVKYSLPVGYFFWYAPYGPVIVKNTKGLATFFADICRKILEDQGGAFMRIDATPFDRANNFFPFGFKHPTSSLVHISSIQPRAEWTLNIEKTQADLLAKMHEKTRYSIRLAEKKGVIAIIEEKNFNLYFEEFYGLMEATSKRNGFSIHPKKYYKAIFDNLESNGGGFLSVAKHEADVLAIHLVCTFGDSAYYLFGATSDEKKNLCGPYLAHWAAILEAKKRRLKFYNFGGIETTAENDGAWQGITTFKKKFGGETLVHAGLLDLVRRKNVYKAFSFFKKIKK